MSKGIKKVKRWKLAAIKRDWGELSGLWFLADRDRELVLQRTAKEDPSRLEPDTGGKKKSASINTTVLPFWVTGVVAILYIVGNEESLWEGNQLFPACKIQ